MSLRLAVAGPAVRSVAWALDAAIRAMVYLAAFVGLVGLGSFGMGLLLLAAFATEWLYPVVFEVHNRGQTPGKAALRIAVVRDDGSPVGWSESLVRNLLRFVDLLPFSYALGLVTMLLSRDFQRLGDLAGGTLVVHRGGTGFSSEELKTVPPLVPPVPLDLDEQRAVLAFAERAGALTPARAQELASLAGPLVAGSADPVRRLLGQAAWIRGQRP